MRIIILTVILGLCASAGSTAPQSCDLFSRSPDSWTKQYGTKAGACIVSSIDLLRQAAKPSFDLATIRKSSEDGSLSGKCYGFLDQAMACEKLIDRSDKAASEAAKLTKDQSLANEFTRPRDDISRFLRCRMRIILGISRASIAQRMAYPSSRSYCSQAMEASVDALRDAVKLSGGSVSGLGSANPPAQYISNFRSRLFDIWEISQKTASVQPVSDMQLENILQETLWPVQKNCPLEGGLNTTTL